MEPFGDPKGIIQYIRFGRETDPITSARRADTN